MSVTFTPDFSGEFAKLIPADRIEGLRKALAANTLTADDLLEVLGEEGRNLLALGLQIEQSQLANILMAQQKATQFRKWFGDQIPDVIGSEVLAEALTSDSPSDNGTRSEIDAFDDITGVGTLPFFIPFDDGMIPMMRIDVLTKNKTEASVSVDAEDATFISLAVTRGIAELLQQARPLAKAGLLDKEGMADLTVAVQKIAQEAERCVAVLAEITESQEPVKK